MVFHDHKNAIKPAVEGDISKTKRKKVFKFKPGNGSSPTSGWQGNSCHASLQVVLKNVFSI
jgi:hypothetical protein